MPFGPNVLFLFPILFIPLLLTSVYLLCLYLTISATLHSHPYSNVSHPTAHARTSRACSMETMKPAQYTLAIVRMRVLSAHAQFPLQLRRYFCYLHWPLIYDIHFIYTSVPSVLVPLFSTNTLSVLPLSLVNFECIYTSPSPDLLIVPPKSTVFKL